MKGKKIKCIEWERPVGKGVEIEAGGGSSKLAGEEADKGIEMAPTPDISTGHNQCH